MINYLIQINQKTSKLQRRVSRKIIVKNQRVIKIKYLIIYRNKKQKRK